MSWLESFAPKRRLRKDSSKSPACEATDSMAAITAMANSPPRLDSSATVSAAITAAAVPPTAPDQVFFGLTFGISLGPPTARPMKYAKMSVVQTMANTMITAMKP